MQTALRLVAGAIAFGVLAVGVIAFSIDARAKAAIERSAAHALGVDTRVRFVSLGFLRGSARFEGFEVSNPPGFESPNFLEVRRARADVTLESLRAERVPVGVFTLEGVTVTLEGDAERANFRTILESLDGLETGSDPEDRAPRSYAVREIAIRDVSVFVSGDPGADGPALSIEEIQLRDVSGVALPVLTANVVEEILVAIAREGSDLPPPLRDGLQAALARPAAAATAVAEPAPAKPVARSEPDPDRRDEADLDALFRDLPGVSLPGWPLSEAEDSRSQ